MKFFANWQPLKNEDAHTALVFGFLRHAPADEALNPWLSDVLGHDVHVEQLQRADFWPRYPSEDQDVTEPDLAFTDRPRSRMHQSAAPPAHRRLREPHLQPRRSSLRVRAAEGEAVGLGRSSGAAPTLTRFCSASKGGVTERAPLAVAFTGPRPFTALLRCDVSDSLGPGVQPSSCAHDADSPAGRAWERSDRARVPLTCRRLAVSAERGAEPT